MDGLDRPTLVLMNIQRGYDYRGFGKRNGMYAEWKMKQLLTIWREKKLPVIHARFSDPHKNSPLHRANAGFRFKDGFHPQKGEKQIVYSSYNAYSHQPFQQTLQQRKANMVIFIGFSLSPHIMMTIQSLKEHNISIYIVEDATVSFEKNSFDGRTLGAEDVHYALLSSLHETVATVISSFTAKQLAKSVDYIYT